MGSVRIKLNSAGFRAYLNSPEVVNLLEGEAEQIAARATSNTKIRVANVRNPDPYVVDAGPGANRARAAVITANPNGMLAEVHERALSKAVG